MSWTFYVGLPEYGAERGYSAHQKIESLTIGARRTILVDSLLSLGYVVPDDADLGSLVVALGRESDFRRIAGTGNTTLLARTFTGSGRRQRAVGQAVLREHDARGRIVRALPPLVDMHPSWRDEEPRDLPPDLQQAIRDETDL